MPNETPDQQANETPAHTKRKYTPAEKAAAIVAVESMRNLDHPEVTAANMLEIPPRNIRDWSQGQHLGPQADQVHLYKAEIRKNVLEQTERLRGKILEKALEAIEGERIPFGQLMSGLKITTEVSQLLSNQPTSIQEQRAAQDEIKRTVAEEALQAIMRHLECDRAAALAYLQEKQPELARWAA